MLCHIKTITLDEFKKHNTRESIWICIGKKVYDITDYVSKHPGGITCILKNATTDISHHAAFHSKKIFELLKPRLIGKLDISYNGYCC